MILNIFREHSAPKKEKQSLFAPVKYANYMLLSAHMNNVLAILNIKNALKY